MVQQRSHTECLRPQALKPPNPPGAVGADTYLYPQRDRDIQAFGKDRMAFLSRVIPSSSLTQAPQRVAD
jgi:hypothetical protein